MQKYVDGPNRHVAERGGNNAPVRCTTAVHPGSFLAGKTLLLSPHTVRGWYNFRFWNFLRTRFSKTRSYQEQMIADAILYEYK